MAYKKLRNSTTIGHGVVTGYIRTHPDTTFDLKPGTIHELDRLLMPNVDTYTGVVFALSPQMADWFVVPNEYNVQEKDGKVRHYEGPCRKFEILASGEMDWKSNTLCASEIKIIREMNDQEWENAERDYIGPRFRNCGEYYCTVEHFQTRHPEQRGDNPYLPSPHDIGIPDWFARARPTAMSEDRKLFQLLVDIGSDRAVKAWIRNNPYVPKVEAKPGEKVLTDQDGTKYVIRYGKLAYITDGVVVKAQRGETVHSQKGIKYVLRDGIPAYLTDQETPYDTSKL